jgi:hypothetical protein
MSEAMPGDKGIDRRSFLKGFGVVVGAAAMDNIPVGVAEAVAEQLRECALALARANDQLIQMRAKLLETAPR